MQPLSLIHWSDQRSASALGKGWSEIDKYCGGFFNYWAERRKSNVHQIGGRITGNLLKPSHTGNPLLPPSHLQSTLVFRIPLRVAPPPTRQHLHFKVTNYTPALLMTPPPNPVKKKYPKCHGPSLWIETNYEGGEKRYFYTMKNVLLRKVFKGRNGFRSNLVETFLPQTPLLCE